MNDYLISMALSVLFQTIKNSVKNSRSKSNMKSAFLKLYQAIRDLYAGDPNFK